MTAITNGYAQTRTGQMHFAEAGTGAPLLLMGETPRGWKFFAKLLPLLAPHVRAIAVDLPGLGNSHGLPDPMSIPALAGCVVDLLDALGIERADVFGMHTGDKVAAALAADSPGRVGKLVLAGQTHSLFPEMDKRNEALAPSFARYHASKAGPGEDGMAKLIREWLGAKLVLDATWWPGKVVDGSSGDARLVEIAEEKSVDYLLGWRSAVAIYRAVFAYDLAEAVGRIEAETLVLEFMTEEEAHYGAQGERLARLMKRATSKEIPVTFLAALEEQPAEVSDAVMTFLGR